MRNSPIEASEALENLDIYVKRTILIKIAYILLGIIVSIKLVSVPPIILAIILLMVIYAIIIFFLVRRYIKNPESINNTIFLLALLDIILITIIINFLGISLYITYPFYIILGFMTLSRHKAIYLTAWVVILYLGLIFFQYFQISQPLQFFSSQEENPHNPIYVLAMASLYLVTLLFLSLRCYDFYKIIEKRIQTLKKTQLTLEEEKGSLEVRIQARKTELKKEKEGLEEKVKKRKRELEEENKKIGERIEGLERFRKVAIGREMKTKELKKEIASFKKEAK